MQILPDGEKKPQAKQLQGRVEHLLKLIQKYTFAQRIIEEVKKPRKRAPKVGKAEPGSVEPLSGQTENEASTPRAARNAKARSKSKDADAEPGKKEKKSKESKKSPADKAAAKKKDKEKDKKKKKRKRDLSAPAMHFTANAEPQIIDGDLPPQVFAQCKEKMRPVKKWLKQLDKPDSKLSESEQMEQIKICLLKIGRRIGECLDEVSDPDRAKEWRNNLWTFVSKFTEYNPKKLYRLYKHTLRGLDRKEDSNHSSNHTSMAATPAKSGSVLTPTNHHSGSRHSSSAKYPPVSSSSSSSSTARHAYPPKDGYYPEKRPNCTVQSPVKRSRMDDYPSGGRDSRGEPTTGRSDPSARLDALRLEPGRTEAGRGQDLNPQLCTSGARRANNWHAPSPAAGSYDSQDRFVKIRPYDDDGTINRFTNLATEFTHARYRPYSGRAPHADKYHQNRYGSAPTPVRSGGGGGGGGYGAPPVPPPGSSSPYYQSGHGKPPPNNATHAFAPAFTAHNSQRDNRPPPDWSV